MKISPINYSHTSSLKQIKFASSRAVGNFLESKSELPKVPAEFLQAQFPINKNQYVYKPIASVKPMFGPVGNYDNLDKFSELFANKINSQLLIPTEKDIENLIGRIKKATNANENEIREVLYNLTNFSNYGAFSLFDNLIQKNNITSFGFPFQFEKFDTFDFSSNSAMEYLIKNKRFLKYPINDTSKPEKRCCILDDITLSQLEHYKNSSDENEREIFNKFLENLDEYVFVVPKGWEIKTKDNGYKSANMFTGTGYLEDMAIEVIKRLQKGENHNNIYYSDSIERLINLVDDVELKKKIDVIGLDKNFKPEYLTNEGLLNSITSLSLSKDYIKAALKSYIEVKKRRNGRYKNPRSPFKIP